MNCYHKAEVNLRVAIYSISLTYEAPKKYEA